MSSTPTLLTPLLLVRAGGLLCGLPAPSVVEAFRPLALERVGAGPAFVLGSSRVRGNTLPVVNLAALIQAPGTGIPGRFVTVRAGERQVVLAVDSVQGVFQPESQEPPQPLLAEGAPGVEALARLDAELLLVLRASCLMPYDRAV